MSVNVYGLLFWKTVNTFIQFLEDPLLFGCSYRPSRPWNRSLASLTDRNLGISQTEQAEIWVLARPNRPKYGYWPDRTDRNMGIRQTEQTKIAIGQTEGASQIFSRPLWTVAPTPLSATQAGLANTCLESRTSSWEVTTKLAANNNELEWILHYFLFSHGSLTQIEIFLRLTNKSSKFKIFLVVIQQIKVVSK